MLTELHKDGAHKFIVTTPTDEIFGEAGELLIFTYPKALGDRVCISIREEEPTISVDETDQTLTAHRAESTLMLPLDEFKQLVNALETTLNKIEEES